MAQQGLQGGDDGGVQGVPHAEHTDELPVHRAEDRVFILDARGQGDALLAHKVAVAHQDLLALGLGDEAVVLEQDLFDGQVLGPLRAQELVEEIAQPGAGGPDGRGRVGHHPVHG